MENIGRRSFLTGLGALIVAPSIVRVQSIMPVKSFDPAYYRYLIDYNVGSDRMMLRMDKALFNLKTPNHVAAILTEAEVKAKFPEQLAIFKDVALAPNVQKCLTVDLGFNYWYLKDKLNV